MTVADKIPVVDATQLQKTAWVGSITLPMHTVGNSKSHFVQLNKNYTFVKHLMSTLNLRQNNDYIIVRPNQSKETTITLKFRPGVEDVASMVVLHWYRYKDAKVESTL